MANSKSNPSTDPAQALLECLGRHIRPGQRLCVALSGGVDSTVLLHATSGLVEKLQLRGFFAVHINHGLSPHAGEWEAFCRTFCGQLGIAFESRSVQVKVDGGGVEAAARKARHAALQGFDCDWILLGHHRDDQAETLLLNLLRGAGVHGAAAMREMRGRLLRPFLDLSREQILLYAKRNALPWIEDESNDDSRYRRNFLRREIMPALARQFPQAAHNLARSAQAFADVADMLDQIACEDMGEGEYLDVARLSALSEVRAANLLAWFLRRQGLQIPGSARLKEMLRQLLSAGSDSQIRCVIGDREVRRFRNRVWVTAPADAVSPAVTWRGEAEVAWGTGSIRSRLSIGEGIDAAVLKNTPLRFSLRSGGESMQLRENGPRRPLKDLLREAGVPPWRRGDLPILYAGDEVVWVPTVGIAGEYRCKPGAEGVLIEFDGVTW